MLRVYQRVRAVAGLHGRALSGLPDIAASFPTLTFIDKESLVQTLSGPEAGKTLVVDVRQQVTGLHRMARLCQSLACARSGDVSNVWV